MQCTGCGGGLEYNSGGANARCTRCGQLYSHESGRITPLRGEGGSPELIATQLGFGPPGTNATAPPGRSGGAGTDEKGGHWGLVLGAAILGVSVLALLAVGITFALRGNNAPPVSTSTAKWDGKSTYECSGGNVKIEGVTASVAGTAIRAQASCVLTLVNVNLTAPIGIDAGGNARVTVTGGSIHATTNSVIAQGSAQVTVNRASVTGKVKMSGNGRVIGVK